MKDFEKYTIAYRVTIYVNWLKKIIKVDKHEFFCDEVDVFKTSYNYNDRFKVDFIKQKVYKGAFKPKEWELIHRDVEISDFGTKEIEQNFLIIYKEKRSYDEKVKYIFKEDIMEVYEFYLQNIDYIIKIINLKDKTIIQMKKFEEILNTKKEKKLEKK